jgi:integrase
VSKTRRSQQVSPASVNRELPTLRRLLRVGVRWPNAGPQQRRFASAGVLFPNTLYGQHYRVRKALALPKDFVIHSLRHTFGTRLAAAGADSFVVMKLMGHSSMAVSAMYVHPKLGATMEQAIYRLGA